VSCLLNAPVVGSLLRRGTTTITYTGRRSGRTFSTPVSFRRDGDTVTVGVMAPNAKNWWRNFEDGGHPIALRLDGADRTGHGGVTRDDAGRVSVTVTLDPLT
jgi:hypothetical protein